MGQLEPGKWMGGLRTETLRKGEEHSIGYFYWLVVGTTDSQLGDGVKTPDPYHVYMKGLESPMGTVHGLSKYPYMREARRIIGRESFLYENGFMINEIDISRRNYQDDFYKQNFDLIYIDGPTSKPINNQEEKLKIVNSLRKKKKMPNIDIELFIKNGNPPKYILIDGRRSTVRRLCKYYADIYDIYLRYYYQPKWDKSGTFLYHTLLIRRS